MLKPKITLNPCNPPPNIKRRQCRTTIFDPNIEYKRCKGCNTLIAVTKQNPKGKCPFRFCEEYGYDSELSLNKELEDNYVGKHAFAADVGDVVHCIDVTPQNELICITISDPSMHIVSEAQFRILLRTGYLYVYNNCVISDVKFF